MHFPDVDVHRQHRVSTQILTRYQKNYVGYLPIAPGLGEHARSEVVNQQRPCLHLYSDTPKTRQTQP